MNITMIGPDIAKQIFHAAGLNQAGKVYSSQLWHFEAG